MDNKKNESKDIFPQTLLFLWFSGAEVEILKELPTERRKYVSIGVTVLLITILATISGAYTFVSVFQNVLIGILFGVLWGVLIFTLYRYGISIVTKTSSTVKNLISTGPGLLISILISIIISTPLQLKIFENQIHNEHNMRAHELIFSANSEYGKLINSIEKEVQSLKEELNEKSKLLQLKETEYRNELAKRPVTQKNQFDPLLYFSERQFERVQTEYNNVRRKNDSLIYDLNRQSLKIRKEMDIAKQKSLSQTTFSDLLNAFSSLRKKSETIKWATILISLIFILIAIAPILILIRKGLYDEYIILKERKQLNKFEFYSQEKETNNEAIKSSQDEAIKTSADFDNTEVGEVKNESGKKEERIYAGSNFEKYFNQMLGNFSSEAYKIEKRARELFRQGMIFSVLGILTAVVLLLFWFNYFGVHKFELQDIMKVVSGTIIILLIEILGAWFLRQYKISSEKSLHILKIKATLDRYFLIYLSINEFASSINRENYLASLIATLDKELRFPIEYQNFDDMKSTKDAATSISNLTDTIKNIGK